MPETETEEIALPCMHGWTPNEIEQRFIDSGSGVLTPSQYWNESVVRAEKLHGIPYHQETIESILGDTVGETSQLIWRPIQQQTEVTIKSGFECLKERVVASSFLHNGGEIDVEALLSYSKCRVQHHGYRIMVWSRHRNPLLLNGRWRRAKPLEVIASLVGLFLSDKQPGGDYYLSDCYLISCTAQGGKMSLDYATALSRMQSPRLWVLQPDEGFLDLE